MQMRGESRVAVGVLIGGIAHRAESKRVGDRSSFSSVIPVLVLVTLPHNCAHPRMDEATNLDALATVIGEISDKPYDLSLHLRHIELAKSLDDLDSQIMAYQTLSQFLAVGDAVWLPYIDAKEKILDLTSAEGVQELLELYERAEADYLCKFIAFSHRPYSSTRTFSHSNPSKAPPVCC